MTDEEMLAYAKSVVDGAPVRKIEVQAFLKAFVARTETRPKPDPASGRAAPLKDFPALNPEEYERAQQAYTKYLEFAAPKLPHIPFVIEKTDTGIHVPRDANRFYTRAEAAALIHAISKALET